MNLSLSRLIAVAAHIQTVHAPEHGRELSISCVRRRFPSSFRLICLPIVGSSQAGDAACTGTKVPCHPM